MFGGLRVWVFSCRLLRLLVFLCDCGFVVLLVFAWGLLRSFTVLVVLICGFDVCGMFVRCSEVSFLCGFIGVILLAIWFWCLIVVLVVWAIWCFHCGDAACW